MPVARWIGATRLPQIPYRVCRRAARRFVGRADKLLTAVVTSLRYDKLLISGDVGTKRQHLFQCVRAEATGL